MTRALLILLALFGPALAQDFPTSALMPYSDFRQALLKNQWMPDEGYGDVAYGFPEVICGNSMCSARWFGEDGHYMTITLWQNDTDKLFVAPQVEDDQG